MEGTIHVPDQPELPVSKTSLIFTLIFALAVAYAVRSLFPLKGETVFVRTPPVTVYDTVKHLDTIWVAKLRRHVDTLWLDRFTRAEPETVYVLPHVVGMTALLVPKAYGDTMIAMGFEIRANPFDDTTYIKQPWRARWVYNGPLEALITDTLPPRASFFPPPVIPKGCGLLCKLGHYTVGAAGGYAVCRLGA